MGSDAAESRAAVTVKGGASLVQCRSVFSADSKYVLCPSGHNVKVFAVASGDCVREFKGHTDVVTGIRLNSKNHFQVLTCSLDGTLKQWDLLDGALLKSYEFRHQLFGLYAVPSSGRSNADDPSVMVITQQSRQAFSVVHGCLVEGADVKQFETIFPSVRNQENHLAVGCQEDIAAYVFSQVLGVYSFSKRQHNEQKLSDQEEFTCVACHPSEQCVVTGTSSGRIYYWYNLLGGNKIIRTSYHWHSLPVLDLSFTAEGSCLLSGGHECVLVKWQYGTQQKDFLPRLGGPIIHVSCSSDSTAYAVCHADNVIQVVSNGFVVHQIIQGLTRDHLAQNALRPLPVGLLLDPRTGSLVTNGKPGHLQFFSLAEDKLLYNLDIVGQNYVSSSSMKEPLVMTQVECADFDRTGTWLATIESRTDGHTADEIRLKFWEYKKESQTYVLNTDVNLPHSKKVHCIRFSKASASAEGSLAAVTASADGRFKLWSLVDNSDIYRKGVCWHCDSVGYYKELSCGDACFSDDGSLLAAAFEHTATLWDPTVNSMKIALPVTAVTKGVHIRQLLFGCGTSSHLLVATTDVSVTVWNLLSCCVLWTTASVKPQLIVRDPCSAYMALFTATRSLIVFSPSDPTPVHVQHEASPARVVSAFFVPLSYVPCADHRSYSLPWQRHSRLYYVDNLQMLLTLDREENAANVPDKKSTEVLKAAEDRLQESIPLTPFSLLIGAERKRKPDVSRNRRWRSHQDKAKHLIQQMTNTPAHVQPPVALLCKRFISACVLDGDRRISPASNLEGGSDDDDGADSAVLHRSATAKISSDDSDNDTNSTAKDESSRSSRRFPASASAAATDSARDIPGRKCFDNKSILEPSTLQDFDWLAKEITYSSRQSKTTS